MTITITAFDHMVRIACDGRFRVTRPLGGPAPSMPESPHAALPR